MGDLVSDPGIQVNHIKEKELDRSVEVEGDGTTESAIVGNTAFGEFGLGTDDKSVTAVGAEQIVISLTRVTSGKSSTSVHDHGGVGEALTLVTGKDTDGDAVLRSRGVKGTTGVAGEVEVHTRDVGRLGS